MKKISPQKAIELSKKLGKPIGDSNAFYLASNCFVETRNGEEIVFDKDVVDRKIKPLFLPKKEENMTGPISIATDEDIKRLEEKGIKIEKELYGNEYIYRTKDIINLEGPEFRSFRKSLNKFKKSYNYKILKDYPKDKILLFLESWAKQKESTESSEATKRNRKFELAMNLNWIELFDKLPNKRLFIEINGELAGFSVFVPLHKDMWVALMQKTDHRYSGVSKLLYHLKAQEMSDIEFFTTGNPGDDRGLIASKESLHPVRKIPTYVINILGKK